MWALRRDLENLPPYLEFTSSMERLQKRHAWEIAQQAYMDQLQKSAVDKKAADTHMSLVKRVYDENNDSTFPQAEEKTGSHCQ